MPDDASTRSWDGIVDDWVVHADANDYRNHYLMPRMLAMLGQVAGKAMLDLGCGEGSSVTDEELQRSHRSRKLRRIPYFLFIHWIKE